MVIADSNLPGSEAWEAFKQKHIEGLLSNTILRRVMLPPCTAVVAGAAYFLLFAECDYCAVPSSLRFLKQQKKIEGDWFRRVQIQN